MSTQANRLLSDDELKAAKSKGLGGIGIEPGDRRISVEQDAKSYAAGVADGKREAEDELLLIFTDRCQEQDAKYAQLVRAANRVQLYEYLSAARMELDKALRQLRGVP